MSRLLAGLNMHGFGGSPWTLNPNKTLTKP